MEKYYCFAGVELAVRLETEDSYRDDRTLTAFRVESVSDPHRFTFRFVDCLSDPEGTLIAKEPTYWVYRMGENQLRYIGSFFDGLNGAYLRVTHRGKSHTVELKKSEYIQEVSAKTVLNAIAAEHLVAQAGGFVFHCAYVEYEGGAILFTAPSGTGKSTQAELWRSLRGAEVINGDRAAVRVTDEGFFAGGIPFAGSSMICKNKTLPLRTVVYLSQAPETTIRRLQGLEAFRSIWEGVSVNTWDEADMRLVSQAVQQIAQEIPVYHLACTPDESAVTALEQALRKQALL